MRRTFLLIAAIVLTTGVQSASAHYLWVMVDQKQKIANVIFEHGASPGPGTYNEPFVKRGKVWVHTAGSKPTASKLTEITKGKKRWMQAKIAGEAPLSVDSYTLFGTYKYGKIDVLLHYYARNITVKTRDELASVASAPHLGFAIEPRYKDGHLVMKLVFAGKPAVGNPIVVRGPGTKHNLKTDKNGEARFKVGKAGRYFLRAYNLEGKKGGEFEGKAYIQTRHHSTVVLNFP